MTLLFVSVLVVLIVSGICSLTEAALYAARRPYIRQLTEAGSASGKFLSAFKKNMERPISAILIVNTAANTAGAAVAGAQARSLFGEASLLWFSASFTLAVLLLSEILPKVVGVVYNRPVAKAVAIPLQGTILVLHPIIWLVERLSRFIKPNEPMLAAPEEEVQQLAMISAEEGSIHAYEAQLVQNVLRLNDVRTHEIMTPRPVALKLPSELTVREAADKVDEWIHSRIPIYHQNDPDTWVGIVLSRDILAHMASDQFDVTLQSLAKPLYFVSEKTPGHVLLKAFLSRRSHLFAVVDEYGGVTGIVTLEDVMESLIGEEIVDEVDSAVDMQEVARLRHRDRLRQAERDKGHDSSED